MIDTTGDSGATSLSISSKSSSEDEAAVLVARLIGADANATRFPVTVTGMFGASIREWRTKNWLEEVTEAVAILRSRGVPPEGAKQIATGDLHRIFENGSKVDDPALKSLWSALLANTADPGKSVTPRPVLVETLNRLGALEANMLQFLWSLPLLEADAQAELGAARAQGADDQQLFDVHKKFQKRVETAFQTSLSGYSPEEVKTALSLLIRDDLISPNIHSEGFFFPQFPSINRREARVVDPDSLKRVLNEILKRNDLMQGRSEAKLPEIMSRGSVYYHLTPFGRELMDACH